MKKIILLLTLALWGGAATQAQEYKLAKNSGKLIIRLNGGTVEGYNGNEIVITSRSRSRDEDERAKGLRVINGSGLEDNTGLGLNLSDKGNTVELAQVGKLETDDLVIKVPKAMSVSFSYDKVMNHSPIRFRNMENEIEVSALYNDIRLDNVSGPMTVKSVYGKVDGSLGANIKGPISLVSVYGHVDLAMSPAAKANMSLSSPWGEIFAASEFKFEMEKTGEMQKYGSEVKGKLNGGGTDISIKSNWGKIYLRKN